MNILCIIPARGGSKRLKDKNITPFYGKPIIAYTIEAALRSRLVDKIVISTDDEKIARVAMKYDVQVVKRPKEYSTDMAPIEQALRHVVRVLKGEEGYLADIVVWLQANIPIRKKGQIDEVLRHMIRKGADSAVTVYPVSQYPQWMKRMDRKGLLSPFLKSMKTYRAQDVEPMYLLDGAVVAMKRSVLMRTENRSGVHTFLGKRMVGIVQDDRKYSVEVDDGEDLNLARYYFKK
jgi:N-acylneuraminate cytidylyltransferase/CMP-N,N'-diacetyllegionaminic acid synthase